MSPDQIQAIGGAVAAILTAWQVKVCDLKNRLRTGELERDTFRTKFRAATRHIREWMGWAMRHAPGHVPPLLPAELRDDI
ncbi:hypothetical protein [Mycobacteroides abscessus]|uniref:hypothetical protein n=1 Tax=Mycobacteroides abscessus TaxID=36809 RepID=UPI000378E0D7|nr:hypothetical protein [Mycobacteroides abscessus]